MKLNALVIAACAVAAGAANAQAIKRLEAAYPVEGSSLPFEKPAQAAATATATATAIAQPAAPAATWDIQVKDINLAGTFQRWAKDAGWQVRWDARKHVLVEAPDRLAGSFEDALRAVLESPGIAQGAYPLEVCFYPNNPPLARVTRKGDQAKECN